MALDSSNGQCYCVPVGGHTGNTYYVVCSVARAGLVATNNGPAQCKEQGAGPQLKTHVERNAMSLIETPQEVNTTELARQLDAAQHDIDAAFARYQARIDAETKKAADDLDTLVRRLHLAINRQVPHDGLCDRCNAFAGDCLEVDRPSPTSYRTTDSVCGPCRTWAAKKAEMQEHLVGYVDERNAAK